MSSPRNSRCGRNPPRTRRGSAIITVLILAAVTAVLASGFLFRSAQEAKLATRSFFNTVALNLAEAGIEEGLFAINTNSYTSANGWTVASDSATSYVKTVSSFALMQATGSIRVRIDNPTSSNPAVVAAGIVDIPKQPRLLKQLRVAAQQRHLWANGIVAKGTLTFSGNNDIDSYDSSLGVHNSATNRSDQATVATTSTALDPIVIGSRASIYGYVATAGGSPDVGPGGMIYGVTTPLGTNIDTSRIRRDFTTNLPDATAPAGTAVSLSAISSTLTLPRGSDTPGANGRYLYTTNDLSLAGSDSLNITGPVDLVVTGNISTAGNAAISITGSTARLNLYSPGTINLTGNAVQNNTNIPAYVSLWGTAPSSGAAQSIKIAGNGSFTGTVYAPNADITLTGNGATNGAIICKTLTAGGNGQFHYDVRLADLRTPLDLSLRPTAWCELVSPPNSGKAFARDIRVPFNTMF